MFLFTKYIKLSDNKNKQNDENTTLQKKLRITKTSHWTRRVVSWLTLKNIKTNRMAIKIYSIRKVWRYQSGNQNPYIEEGQTTQWSKDRQHNGQKKKTDNTMVKRKRTKGQNNVLQNITHKTKDRVTRAWRKTGGELRCSGRVSSSCSISGSRRVNLVTNAMISESWK